MILDQIAAIPNRSKIQSEKLEQFFGIDFEDQEEVGFGFSGLVLKSLHRPTNRTLARKIIHETPRKRRELFATTHLEVEFYEKFEGCKAGNIVKCFGVLPKGHKGHIHGGLVFEFMDLGSLSDHLTSKSHDPLPEPIILRIAKNLLKACAQMESLGIVHRDIKPSNILFDSKGGVKLCDFGEACFSWESQDRDSEYGRMAGSTAYMAPERLACLEHSHPSDIWSVGLVLLELTLSNFPFSTSHSQSQSQSLSHSSSSQLSFQGSDCSIIELWETVMESENLPQVSTQKYSLKLAELVRLCMKRNSRDRPTAQSLLETFSDFFDNNSATSTEFVTFFNKSK